MKTFKSFLAKHVSDSAKMDDLLAAFGYSMAQTLEQVIRQCGDDLTRANIMKQAANLKNFTFDLLLPGIKINTGPADFYPIKQVTLIRLEGGTWKLFGPPIGQ